MSLPEARTGGVASACPRRRVDVRPHEVDSELVIFDRQRQLIHQLNLTASYIWQRCDGQRTIAAIATEVARAFDVDRDVAEQDVARAVRQLEAAGLVEVPAA